MDWLDQALDGDVGLQLVQQPVGRPEPIRRPGEVEPRGMAPRSRPAAPVAQQPKQNDDFLFEAPAPLVASSSPRIAPQGDRNAEPDAPTWMGRRWQDIAGKQDKRFAGLPTIAEALKAEGNMTFGTAARESGAWLTGASDEDMAGVYQGILGDRFVRTEQDANGYPVVVYRGKDGNEAKAYVNKPGLDMQDVVRGVEGIAPYVGVGRIISAAQKGATLVPRMVAQAIGQAGTSVAQDAAGVVTGVSDLNIEKSAEKGMLSAAGGAAGELVGAAAGAIWRKFVTEPKYFNQSTGQLTQEGMRAAEQAGLDPRTLSKEMASNFSREMARTADAFSAANQIAANDFKIPRSVGELTRDQGALLREQQITAGNYGQRGADLMKQFRDRQSTAIKDAVTGMADDMAPGRAGQPLGKADLGANIRANTQGAYETAKEFDNKAWKAVPELKATNDALAHLDVSIPRGLQQRGIDFIDNELTPAAAKMSKMLEEFQAGGTPASASKYVKAELPGKVDLMRRQLLKAYGTAENETDKRAAKALYDSFNDWIGDVAPMIADPLAATQLVTARALSRQIHEHFDGEAASAGANILKNVLKKADSAEGVIDALFSGQTKSSIKSGSIDAINRLKDAYTRYLEPEAAKAAIDDLKLAFFRRAVMKGGEVMEPKALSSSLKNMLSQQRTTLETLGITKEEMSRIGRLAGILDDVAKKNPNTSWSGVTMSQFLKDIAGTLFTMLGGNSVVGRVAAGTVMKPVQEQYGKVLFNQATRGGQGAIAPRLPPPPFAGPGAGIAASDRQ